MRAVDSSHRHIRSHQSGKKRAPRAVDVSRNHEILGLRLYLWGDQHDPGSPSKRVGREKTGGIAN